MAAYFLKHVPLLSLILNSVTGTPISATNHENCHAKKSGFKILRTTTTNSHTIDWVPIESQGKIASPPPKSAGRAYNPDPAINATIAPSELQLEGAQLGPPGTVPIPRLNTNYDHPQKSLPSQGSLSRRDGNAGRHWYVTSTQQVFNTGGSAIYSLFNAATAPHDFSLLQTAITVDGGQTIEAGWMNYPDQIQQPHLFTYFTTTGYAADGDNVGGYNQEQRGWVQIDERIYPGSVMAPLSVDGGAQYEMKLEWNLFEENWWLFVNGGGIGYYPASIFDNPNIQPNLASGASYVYYYGEIFNSDSALTPTDMGSGEFASAGFGKSAYIRNMLYSDTNGREFDYAGAFFDSNSSLWTHDAHIASGTPSGSSVWIGGPGADGKIGV